MTTPPSNNADFDFAKSEITDFGFEFSDAVTQEEASKVEDELKKAKEKAELKDRVARELLKRITVFANNLMKDPQKPTIHWPDRVTKIESWLKELNEIYKTGKQESE